MLTLVFTPESNDDSVPLVNLKYITVDEPGVSDTGPDPAFAHIASSPPAPSKSAWIDVAGMYVASAQSSSGSDSDIIPLVLDQPVWFSAFWKSEGVMDRSGYHCVNGMSAPLI